MSRLYLLGLSVILILVNVGFQRPTGDPSKVNEVIAGLKSPKRGSEPERFELSEEDINAWTTVVIQGKRGLGVRDVRVDLLPDNRIFTKAFVNMDEVRLDGYSSQLLKSMLEGEQLLEANGRLEVSEGKGSYRIETATLNGVEVPPFLVNYVLSYLSQNQPPNVDITEPFDLPFGIQDIQTTGDQLLITR